MPDPLYIDTSAWVLRYEHVTLPVTSPEIPYSSALLHPETHSALARKAREGRWTATERRRMREQCRRDLEYVCLIECTAEVRTLAEWLLWRHPLRAADAIHLASALMIGRELDVPVHLATADQRLAKAAVAERLRVEWMGPSEQSPTA